jgi:hypothetical protein
MGVNRYESPKCPDEGFPSHQESHNDMTSSGILGEALFLGPFTSPPILIGTLIVLLLIVIVGRILIGLAWRLLLIAIAVVVGLWLLGVIGGGLNLT